MAKGMFPPFSGSVTETTQIQKGGDGARRKLGSEEAGYRGKGGKLRLSRISLFKKKPYDRPPLPPGTLDLPSSSGQGGNIPSLPARIVDSASNFLTSSASYLFESFFKRRQTLWIGNGSMHTAERGSTDARKNEGLKPLTHKSVEHVSAPMEGSLKKIGMEKLGNKDIGFIELEEFLKRQSLSRDEVQRLTEALRTRANGGSGVNSNQEVRGRIDMVEQTGEQSNPVQLAKAFMGKRITHQWQGTTPHHNEVAGPYSGKEGTHGRSLADASRGRSAPGASVRMLKRRLIADDEDDVILRGPARRVRQKMTPMTNSSPYIRQVTTASGRLRTPSLPVLQTSEVTQRSSELLEEPALPSKGKSVEELPIEDVPESSKTRDGPSYVEGVPDLSTAKEGPSYTEDVPEASRTRSSVIVTKEERCVLPTSNVLAELSYKLPEPVAAIAPVALDKSSSGLVPASTSELPVISPVKTKGFRISAFFEDSSSDEEADLPLKPVASILTKPPRPLIVNEAEDATMPTQPSTTTSNGLPHSANSAKIPVPILLQPSKASGPSNAKSDTGPEVFSAAHSSQSATTVSVSERSTFSFPNLKPFPVISFVPPVTQKDGETRVAMESTRMPLFVSSSVSVSVPLVGAPTPLPFVSANEALLPDPKAEGAMASVSPLPTANVPGEAATQQKLGAGEIGAPEASGLFPAASLKPDAVSAGTVVPSIAASTSSPDITAASAAAAAASFLPVGMGSSPTATPAAMPVFQGVNETQPVIATAPDRSFEVGIIKPSSTFESPSADNRLADLETMATDPMSEEPDSSTVNSTAPAFSFGSNSSAISVPTGETAVFGSQAAPSPFSFPMQSSAPSGVSLSVQSPFNSQSSSASGQLFAFGSSGSSPSNPFSASSQCAFSFGSSAATSMSSMFTVTSSAPLSFPATSPTPSAFLFGAQASSSSSANSTSGFGGQTTPSASSFTSAGVQNSAPSFPFQGSSTTPTPPSFQFGGASAGTSSMSSNPSFGGQTFSFGGQPTNTSANPFTQSGGSASPFQFGATAAVSPQPAFSSGASPASTFSFGAQPAPSPNPFTFGGQPTASPTGQAFGFGGQPAAPQNPFNLPSSTGQNPSGASGMEFAGGFSLGAAGGEKTGRKFIKAKRIGGAKRGK